MKQSNVIHPEKYLTIVAVLLGLTAIAGTARAELRCDCSQIVESCSAEIGFSDNEISIESSSDACSRVDYLIDGQPFAALIVDGESQFNWNGQPQSSPQIIVENCRVCADVREGNAPAPAVVAAPEVPADDAQSDDSGELKALVKVMPNYPRGAWGPGIEGSVTVEFSVSDDGVVENIKLISSTAAEFVNATLDAVSRFRYTPGNPTEAVQEEFRFRLLNGSEPVVSSATL